MSNDDKWMIAYAWALTVFGAFFIGFELALTENDKNVRLANEKLQNCHRVIAGEIYNN